MNKQELIEAIKDEPYERGIFVDTIKFNRNWLLRKIEKLDEPEPVKVQQFVADWYEEHKDEFEYNVWDWLSSKSELGKIDSKFAFWLNNVDNTPIQTLVNMHQFGYEVEEEKWYVVTLKNRQPLVKSQSGSILYFSQDITAGNYKVTRKEIEEAGFGWVFDCEGIEIEEVEG